MNNRILKGTALLLCALLACGTAAAWGKMGHATVVKIAQDHMTKKTRQKVNEIMKGRSLVGYASYCDLYRSEVDEAFKPAWAEGIHHAHTFEVDENNRPFETLHHPVTGRQLTNTAYFAYHCLEDLKHADSMSESDRWYALVMAAHVVGDMHCPGHVRFAARHKDSGKFAVTFMDEPSSYHHVWDFFMVTVPLPYSFSDIALIVDDCTPEQIAEICKGTAFDWGKDTADASESVRLDAVKEGDVLNKTWVRDHTELVMQQLRNAGYRLAHGLNMAFDPAYARRYNRKYNK